MNMEILVPILAISAIAVGAGLLLSRFDNNDKYDERQLIERGRAAGLAMNTAIVYLLGIFTGYLFNLFPEAYMAIFAVFGLVVMILVHTGYCIFHDAYLRAEKNILPEALQSGLFGGVWLVLALFNNGGGIDWLDLALALDYLATAAMLLLRALVLRIQELRSAKEDADGEE